MKTPTLLLVFFLISIQISVNAQVSTDPAIPTADEAVTIYFDATGTGLEGYTGDVYAHTGITINGNQWQNVIGDWGNNNNQPLLTNIGTDLYTLDVLPTIRAFYSANPNDDITEMCFVFRSAEEPWQQTSPDIFIEVFPETLSVLIASPTASPLFVDPGQSIQVVVESSLSSMLYLYIDDELISSTSGFTIQETILASSNPNSKHWIIAKAEDGTNTVYDSVYFYVRGSSIVADLPDNVDDGINYIDESTLILVLHAPYKSSVFAIGDFNDWEIDPQFRFNCNKADYNDIETRYWLSIENLIPGQEYIFQYFVDESIRIGEPYAEKVSDPWNDQYIDEATYPGMLSYPTGKTEGIATVLQTDQEEYVWQIPVFDSPDVDDLVVYELLIRDFTDMHTFQSLIDTMGYFNRLGINAIELMPVNEFEGNISWGYNPNYYFAVDKYYGPKNTLKAFVDACHANGIAVIIDMVLNHSFGTSPMVKLYWDDSQNIPAANNLWFNQYPTHDFNVGFDFNHESPYTKDFVKRVNNFWLNEFNVDGFRFDLSKGFTQFNSVGNVGLWGQYDQSRVDIWNDYSAAMRETKPNTYIILEHFAENSEEQVLSNNGMMLWGNSNHNYNEGTMGWNANGGSDFSWISYQQRGWSNPHVMGYMESHDEERLMFKNVSYGNNSGGYNIQDTTTALKRQELAAAFFYTIPGPKMIWQFGEMGYDYSIEFNGRTGPKPIRWDYMSQEPRKQLFDVNAQLIFLKKEYDVFKTTNFSLDLWNATKSISLQGQEMNVVVIGNFDVVDQSHNPNWPGTGNWTEYFSGDELEVTSTNQTVQLAPGEYRLYSTEDLGYVQIKENKSESDDVKIFVYPNPAKDVLTFRIQELGSQDVAIRIIDVYGRLIDEIYHKNSSPGQAEIRWNPTNNLEAGIYFAILCGQGFNQQVKFVLE